MEYTLKNTVILIALLFGFLIGSISEPIEKFGSGLMHAILALILAVVLPIWFAIVKKFDDICNVKKFNSHWFNKNTLAWIVFGIFGGRTLLLIRSGFPFELAVVFSLPFLGAAIGIYLSTIIGKRYAAS